MKKLLFFFSLMFAICANAQIDSISYAYGYQCGQEMLDKDRPFMQTADDIKAFYRGIEENMPPCEMANDSAYNVNYGMGVIHALSLVNALNQAPKEDLPPVDCIIAGLQMVAGNQLILPNDTIEARLTLESCTDSIQFAQLSSEERCDFFTAYGVLLGFQDGLDQFMEDLGIGKAEPNYQHFAQGFSDVLDFEFQMATSPENAYDYGKWLIMYLRIAMAQSMCFAMANDMPGLMAWDYKSPDFLAGIRAALGLEEPKLSADEMKSVLDRE